MDQNKSGIANIISLSLFIMGSMIFSFTLPFVIVDCKKSIFGGFFAAVAILIIAPVVLGLLVAAVWFFKKARGKIEFNDLKQYLIIFCVILGLGQLIFYLVYSRPKDILYQTQNIFFSKAQQNLDWVNAKIPFFFARENNLCVINIDGTDEKSLLTCAEPVYDFILSPGSNYIAVLSGGIYSENDLYLARLDTNTSLLVDKDVSNTFGRVQWLSDGKQLFYVKYIEGANKGYIYDVTNNKITETDWRMFSENNSKWDQVDSGYRYKRFDGYHPGFVMDSNSGARIKMDYQDNFLYYVDKDGNKKKIFAVAREGQYLNFPRLVLSPDGEFIIMNNPQNQDGGYYIFEPATGRLSKLFDYSHIRLMAFYDNDTEVRTR